MRCLYLLHFIDKLHHAQHYLGSTRDLMARLERHANGHGAAITRALWIRKENWILSAVWIPSTYTTKSIVTLEYEAKRRHQSSEYCPICKEYPLAPSGTIQIPVRSIAALDLREKKNNGNKPNGS